LALGQAMQDRSLARLAVADQEAHIARPFGNFRAMTREIQVLLARGEALQRGHIIDHRAVRWRHDRGRPAHDMVADEIDLPLGPGESEMVGGVAGRRYGLELPARALDDFAVLDLDVRPELAVGAGFRIVLLALEARPRGAVRTLGINRRAGGL